MKRQHATLPPWPARLLLLLAVVLTLSTLAGPPLKPPPPSSAATGGAGYTDRELYREIVRKVAAGQDYYAAAAATQRAHGYPTAPPWAFREPAETWLLALLGSEAARWGALLLAAAAAVVLMRGAAEQATRSPWRRVAVAVLFGVGLALVAAPAAAYLHETWAAVFIGLSLACWRPGGRGREGRWRLSVAFGLLACLVREIALPYLLVMAAFALVERRRAEGLGWTAALAVLAAALAVHFALAARQHLPGDGVSPGWIRFGGWPFAVLAARRNILLALLPPPLASLALLAGLLGLASVRSPWTARIAGTLGAFLLLFTAVGRPDNYYWGALIAPLAAMGLAFAPEAARDLVRAAWPRSGAALSKISRPAGKAGDTRTPP
jgi:hypothetical protein